jgi:Hydroxymethylglutaryl-coenzyme A synthase N terminal
MSTIKVQKMVASWVAKKAPVMVPSFSASGMRAFSGTSRAENVGILAAETYVPHRFVSQENLEKFDGVSAGKYTVGK